MFHSLSFIFHSFVSGCFSSTSLARQNSLWFSVPLTGALTDPPAVILGFMSAVPESQPQLIQGHPVFIFLLWRIEANLFSGTVPRWRQLNHCIIQYFSENVASLFSICPFLFCSGLKENTSVHLTCLFFNRNNDAKKSPFVFQIKCWFEHKVFGLILMAAAASEEDETDMHDT